jgi:transposase
VSPADTGIAGARAKTDRLDARALAKLLWAGELDAVRTPDERCRVTRRRLSRREQLVRSRSRAKNEIHAVVVRLLVGKPPMSDLFGVKGREWLRSLELPVEEAETIEGCMRHVEFLDAEIVDLERQIAREALVSLEIRRLMTVPGVNVICAAEFTAAIGNIRRFPPRGSLTPISALTRRSANPGANRRAADGSPNRAPRPPGGRWSKRRGQSSASQPRCTPSLSACAPGAAARSPRSLPPASSRACSGAS